LVNLALEIVLIFCDKLPSSLNILIITVHTWPSGTKLISFKQLLKISKFLWPAFFIAAPSTNVFIDFSSYTIPVSIAIFIEGDLYFF
jgi:hypothetical protein